MKNHYDLEERTFLFAKDVALFILKLPRNVNNFTFAKQLIRSASSIGANYIEANEPLGTKDLIMHMKIARKESKETAYWLKLIFETNIGMNKEHYQLLTESIELKYILSKIIINLSHKHQDSSTKIQVTRPK